MIRIRRVLPVSSIALAVGWMTAAMAGPKEDLDLFGARADARRLCAQGDWACLPARARCPRAGGAPSHTEGEERHHRWDATPPR
jgi:hypothetical protein